MSIISRDRVTKELAGFVLAYDLKENILSDEAKVEAKKCQA
jgi:hypothetical protein